jgi:two-component sensor histidine kinase
MVRVRGVSINQSTAARGKAPVKAPRPKLSLRARLFVLTAIALAPALVILVYNEVALRRSREAEVHALALRFGQLAALEMQSIIEGTQGLLLAVAHVPVVRSFDAGPCGAYLAGMQGQSPHLTAISAIDLDGTVRCRTEMPQATQRVQDRPYFKEALASKRFTVGKYTVSRVSGKAILPLATPIRNDTGEIIGVLAAGLDLEWLGQRLRQRDFARGSALTIADRSGVIIAREPYPERFIGTRIPDPFLALVNGTSSGTREVVSQDGTRRIIGYIPAPLMPEGLYVSAGVSRDEAFRAIDQATRRGAILALLGGVIAFLSAWLFGRRFVRRPVARLVGTIRAWRAGDDTARTGMAANAGELETVGAAIDGLMDELAVRQAARERAEEHQKLLLHELNHRVKNTLATVQFIAGQTLRTAATPEEAREIFDARLVALARAHDVLTQQNWEGAELGRIVAQAAEPFSSRNGKRLHIAGPEVRVSARTALALAMAFQELATNAVKYGALSNATGTIRITWALANGVATSGDSLSIRWEESGGPTVQAPTRRGFGSRLLESALGEDLGGDVRIEFAATGVVCTVETLAA